VSPLTESPRFAVIVGAFGRKEYLLRAVRSVRAQTLPRECIELVVSKDFADPEVDRALEASGATIFSDPEGVIGRKQRNALAVSTAPWVTFLDDDDELEPERLARVAEVVRAHPEVGFYRCRVSVIGRDDAPIPRERWRTHEVDRGFDELGAVCLAPDRPNDAFEIGTRRTFATFSSSSMTFRRELLDGEVGEVFQRSYVADTFLYLAAALRPVGLFLDDRRLTRYRHGGWSMTNDPRWFPRAVAGLTDMAELAERHGRTDFARYFRELAAHYGRLQLGQAITLAIDAGAPRRDVARGTAAYLRCLGAHRAERRLTLDTWAAALYGLGYPVAPSAVWRLARRWITAGRP